MTMKDRLNFRFLAYSLLALFVLLTGYYAIHAMQMKRHNRDLLDLANSAEQEGKMFYQF